MEPLEESPRRKDPDGSGESGRPWGLKDIFNPLLWALALVSALILALYCAPLLPFILDAERGSLSERLLGALGMAVPLLIAYLFVFFAGGLIGPESPNRFRRFCAQSLMLFGIMPIAILAVWSYMLRGSRKGSPPSAGSSTPEPSERSNGLTGRDLRRGFEDFRTLVFYR